MKIRLHIDYIYFRFTIPNINKRVHSIKGDFEVIGFGGRGGGGLNRRGSIGVIF